MSFKRTLVSLFWIACLLAMTLGVFAVIGLGLYAHLDACGWRGLFVECRIEAKL